MFYFAIVAFMQLIIACGGGTASAQNYNLQGEVNQFSPSLQPVTPDFGVRRSGGGGPQHPDQANHSAHRKHK
jgi:hypothetical protein